MQGDYDISFYQLFENHKKNENKGSKIVDSSHAPALVPTSFIASVSTSFLNASITAEIDSDKIKAKPASTKTTTRKEIFNLNESNNRYLLRNNDRIHKSNTTSVRNKSNKTTQR